MFCLNCRKKENLQRENSKTKFVFCGIKCQANYYIGLQTDTIKNDDLIGLKSSEDDKTIIITKEEASQSTLLADALKCGNIEDYQIIPNTNEKILKFILAAFQGNYPVLFSNFNVNITKLIQVSDYLGFDVLTTKLLPEFAKLLLTLDINIIKSIKYVVWNAIWYLSYAELSSFLTKCADHNYDAFKIPFGLTLNYIENMKNPFKIELDDNIVFKDDLIFNQETIQLLLREKKENLKNSWQIITSATHGYQDALKYIDIHRDKNFDIALELAATNNQYRFIEYILLSEKKYSSDFAFDDQFTNSKIYETLVWSIESKRISVVQAFCKHFNKGFPSKCFFQLLTHAFRSNLQTIKILLTCNIIIQKKNIIRLDDNFLRHLCLAKREIFLEICIDERFGIKFDEKTVDLFSRSCISAENFKLLIEVIQNRVMLISPETLRYILISLIEEADYRVENIDKNDETYFEKKSIFKYKKIILDIFDCFTYLILNQTILTSEDYYKLMIHSLKNYVAMFNKFLLNYLNHIEDEQFTIILKFANDENITEFLEDTDVIVREFQLSKLSKIPNACEKKKMK